MIEIIEDAESWRRAISKFPDRDFYHTWEYHSISKAEGELPVLLYYEEENRAIGLPFLKRSISNSEWFDLTSVYGYAGPLSYNIGSDFDNAAYQKALLNFLREEKIVSVFSRLNAFIPYQNEILRGIGKVETLGPMVSIDLTKDLEEQRRNYSKTTKRYVNRLRRLCNVVKSSSREDIAKFIELYYGTMDRVDARAGYYFEEDYFYRFLESKEFQTDLMFAQLKETGELICGALMIKTNDIVQYHLSGTQREYLPLTPLRILIDEARIEASQEGRRHFNLGGGLGSQEDSLFYFKSSFSKNIQDFSIWKYVVNAKVYEDLCDSKRAEISEGTSLEESNFFPLYRLSSA